MTLRDIFKQELRTSKFQESLIVVKIPLCRYYSVAEKEEQDVENPEIPQEDENPVDDAQVDKDLNVDDEEEKEGKDLFKLQTLEEVRKDPSLIIKNEKTQEFHNFAKHVKANLAPKEETDGQVHPGFVSSFSFGEKEFQNLQLLLLRLDEVAEKAMTYRKENMMYFPEFYAVVRNLKIHIKFLLDTQNRKRIDEALDYVRDAVVAYTTNKQMNVIAVMVLEEVYELLINLKNFHGLGVSYEKKRNEGQKFGDALFKRKVR